MTLATIALGLVALTGLVTGLGLIWMVRKIRKDRGRYD